MNKHQDVLFSISYKKLSEYSCRIVFKRNKLSRDMFTYIHNSGYYLDKYYKQGNKTVNLSIFIKSNDFNLIFEPQYKLSYIEGNPDNFNLVIDSKTICISDLKRYISSKQIIQNDIIKITCEFIGLFDIPKRFKQQTPDIKTIKKSKYVDITNKIKSSKPSLGNPSEKQSSSGSDFRDCWSVNHPYKGGTFN